MVAWRYEISFLIFHSFASFTREIFFNTWREIPRGHVTSSIYKRTHVWSHVNFTTIQFRDIWALIQYIRQN